MGGSNMEATWMPSTEHGDIHNRAELPESVFAFPRQRKEPLTDYWGFRCERRTFLVRARLERQSDR
jgi:hypothetical protein